MDKEKKKLLRRKIGFFFIKTFSFLGQTVPLKFNFFLGRFFGVLAYFVLSRQRKVALENLAQVFPDYKFKARKIIAKDFFNLMSEGGFELVYYLNNKEKISRAVRIEGRGNLDKALAKRRGGILVSAHFGNFPLMSLRLAVEGYPVNIVARPMRDKYAEAHFHNLRTNAGVKTISAYPRRACVLKIINALAANEIVIIQMDQNFGSGGVWVDFFGKLAATPPGPIVLSLRTKCALIPAYIYGEKENKHCLKIMPEENLITGENKSETILLNTAKFTKIIEAWIRERPGQWSWIHRRWKSRPPKK